MEYRDLGRTGIQVSAVSFGTWAIGGSWGAVNQEEAIRSLSHAIDEGVTFFDTADVYGNGRAEEFLGKVTKERKEKIAIATKFCRQGDIHNPSTYSYESVRSFCEKSLTRLQREVIDLYQIHCPPHEILKHGDVFDVLDRLKKEGKILHYGVSVESIEEGLTAMQYPGVEVLQVIFNLFRQKVVTDLFPVVKQKQVGILARLPLASGLLTGKFTKDHQFERDDHRFFNQNGESFNVGETFAGLPFEKGVELAQDLAFIAKGRQSMASAALRWILEYEEVSCVIPGFKNQRQIDQNLVSLQEKIFSYEERKQIEQLYQDKVHHLIRGSY